MTELKFSDGVKFNTDGAPRIERRHDGLYVVGAGHLVPVDSAKEAQEELETLREIWKIQQEEKKNG